VGIPRQHGAGDTVDQQGDEDCRKRELYIRYAHDEPIDLAADETGDQSETHADDDREQHRRQSDQQGRCAPRT
jgi:hypothetical protein